jgi:hypothetical protein
MKPRLTAALALVLSVLFSPMIARSVVTTRNNKWPLMVPPTIQTANGPKIATDAPLSQWIQMGGRYPSREACEQTRAKWPASTLPPTVSLTSQQVKHGRCIEIKSPARAH